MNLLILPTVPILSKLGINLLSFFQSNNPYSLMKRNLIFAMLFGAVSLMTLPGCGGDKAKEGDAAKGAPATTSPDAGVDPKLQEGGNPKSGSVDPTGYYTLSKADGTEATLDVKKSGDKLSYTLSAHVGNAAEMERQGTLSLVADQEYDDSDDACQITVIFTEEGCELIYGAPFEGCGDVDCAGKYIQEH